MPLVTTLPTWVMLNFADDRSPTGFVDKRTKMPTFGGGLNAGDYFDLTEKEANDLSFTDNGILHAGRYRRVQFDPNGSTSLGGTTGKLGFMPSALFPELNIVTSIDLGLDLVGRIVVFLCPVTPGNYCFVQELGIANVFFSLGSGSGPVFLADDGGASSTGTVLLGYSPAGGSANAVLPVVLNLPVFQG